MKKRFTTAAMFLAVAAFAAQSGSTSAAHASPPGVRYLAPLFSVKIAKAVHYGDNIDFAHDGGVCAPGVQQTLLMDIYLPNKTVALPHVNDTDMNRPAVVWAHGGGFIVGGRSGGAPWVSEMAKRGYVAVTIDYRICEGGAILRVDDTGHLDPAETARVAAAAADMKTAIRFLRENATTYGIDPNRIANGGSSAGAITALSTAVTTDDPFDGLDGSFDHPGYSMAVCTTISVSGATDVDLIDGTVDHSGAIFFHGTLDTVVPLTSMQATKDKMSAEGLPTELHTYVYGHTINKVVAFRSDMQSWTWPWLNTYLVNAQQPCV